MLTCIITQCFLKIGDQEENQPRLQTTKVRQVECHGHLLECYREGVILVIGEEMSRVVSLKVDRVEEQIVVVVEKGELDYLEIKISFKMLDISSHVIWL